MLPPSKKTVARIKRGLGNQLFCYAAARRFAMINNVELVINDGTGFAWDWQFSRQYALDLFYYLLPQVNICEAVGTVRAQSSRTYEMVAHILKVTVRLCSVNGHD